MFVYLLIGRSSAEQSDAEHQPLKLNPAGSSISGKFRMVHYICTDPVTPVKKNKTNSLKKCLVVEIA